MIKRPLPFQIVNSLSNIRFNLSLMGIMITLTTLYSNVLKINEQGNIFNFRFAHAKAKLRHLLGQ